MSESIKNIILCAVLMAYAQNALASNASVSQMHDDSRFAVSDQPIPSLLARETSGVINIYDGLTDIHIDEALSRSNVQTENMTFVDLS